MYFDEYRSNKAIRYSSPIILRKSILRCCKVEFAFLLSGFSFTNIHDSQNSRGKGGYLFITCLICLVSVIICISIAKSLFMGCLKVLLVYATLTITHLISESLLCNTRVTMTILQKYLGIFP